MNERPVVSKAPRAASPDAILAKDREAGRKRTLSAAYEQARRGRFLDALEMLRQAGSFRSWSGPDRIEVAWIVRELGAPRLATWHILKAHREAPQALVVRNAYATEMLSDRGPLETLEFLEASSGPSADDSTIERLHWMWLHSGCYILLRDFPAAGGWIERMEEEAGDLRRLVWFARASLLERQDCYDEAIEAIDRAIDWQADGDPRDLRRPIQYKAHLLTLRGRDDEAHALLAEADARMQVASFSWQMAGIDYERRDYAACRRLLERFESLTPLRERAFGDLFLLFRSELARRLGNDAEAIRYAEQSRSARGRQIAAMLGDPDRLMRTDKILPVPFIRQHELTCGPATLAAISAYWGHPAEHLEVAEEICYAGTTTYAERKWAEENGFATAEFTVTEPVTEALIERDVPFTLVTRAAGAAHLQAVIGYDGRTATILIRDPYHRARGAAGIAELLENQAGHGPRGMALVPREQAALIADLELPDAPLHDLLHRLDGALIEHRRDEAAAVLHELASTAPDHRLTLLARRQLALYDGNDLEMLPPVEKLLERYPDDTALQLDHVSLLGSAGRHRERVERLRELAARPQAHPMATLQLGEALAQDGRVRDEAEQLMRTAIRRAPTVSRAYLELGDLWFARGRRQEALRLYRFAASLEETDELAATRYFDAAVMTGQSEQVMDWLRGRFKRFGGKSLYPAATLAMALLRSRRYTEALAVLREALERRPNDAELKVFVARTVAELSSEHWPWAERLLEDARPSAPLRQWRQGASLLCTLRGEIAAAREHLMELLPLNPLAMPLHESITELTVQLEGEDAAIEHWRKAAARFPYHQPLQERHAMALRERPLEIVQPVLDEILRHSPDNTWAHRELAFHLLSAGRLEQAEEEIALAEQLDAEHDFVGLLRATLAYRRGDARRARMLLREVIARDVNGEAAVARLIMFCQNADQVREELRWLVGRMREATITGDVLLMYREYAEAVLPAAEVLETLQDALDARGDLWPAHQAVIRQLTHMQRIGEATAAVDAATDQFPLEPAAWFERYQVAVAAADHAAQRGALEQVRLLRPSHMLVLRALSELEASLGDFETSRQLLEELVAKQPLDAVSRGYLGDCLLELEQHEAALEQFERAVRLNPEYSFAWSRLDSLADQLGKTGYRERVARELTQERPHEAAAWLHLAYALAERAAHEQAYEALDRAEQIDPYREAVHIARSRFRIHAGDYEGALAALAPEIYADIPVSLTLQRCELMWDLGMQDAAYEQIVQAADENPTAMEVWQRLQGWAMARGDRERAVAAIEHQIAANPHDPDVLDAAGAAFADLQENERAIEMFGRAIEIVPTYTGSRCRLFDLLVERGDWNEAERLVTGLTRMDDHPVVIARRLQAAEHRGDREAQQGAIDGILQAQPIHPWALEQAAEVMVRQGRIEELIGRLEHAIEATLPRAELAVDTEARAAPAAEKAGEQSPAASAEQPRAGEPAAERMSAEEYLATLGRLGAKWAELKLQHRGNAIGVRTQVVDQIRRWMQHPSDAGRESGRVALSMLVEHLKSLPDLPALQQFIDQNQTWLREDTSCWGTIAYAYASTPKKFSKRRMRKWVEGYQDRGPIPAWIYTNVQEILRLTGQQAAAVQAVRAGLAMPPDAMRSQLALWAAHDCLVAEDFQGALHDFMQAARLENLEGTDRVMHVWVESVLMLNQAADREAAFAEVRRRLAEAEPPIAFFRGQPVYRPVYDHTLRQIAQLAGTRAAGWWAGSKRLKLRLLTCF